MHRYPLLPLSLLIAALAGCSDDETDGTCTSQNTVDDGEAVRERQALTPPSAALVRDFVETALVDNDAEAGQAFLGADLAQEGRAHASLKSLLQAASADGSGLRYQRVRSVTADGDLVLTQSDGELDGRAHVFYDLFRVDGGYVVEHWGPRDSPEWR